MNKAETIARYGEDAWEKHLAQRRAYYRAHREQEKAYAKKYREEHPEEAKAAVKKYREEHKEEEKEYNMKYREENPEEVKAYAKKYREEHPEQVKANDQRNNQEQNRKGGRRYVKHLKDQRTGIPGDKNKIRDKHARQYKPYKDIIAPDSQIHHEWVPQTSEYRGVALVEKDQHMHGIVDVIQILDGKITLLTEEEVKKGEKQIGRPTHQFD